MNTQWQEIIGHQGVIAQLQLMMAEGRVPHAMLFAGIQGIGKSLAADVMATALLCHNPHNGQGCGHCPSCRALGQGTHPDFFQLAPDNSGKTTPLIKIEQIRELQTSIARVPILSQRRVVIINDAEKMNEPAANSLLKTIEEPTGQVVFILITSSTAALLDTILSRCMRIQFGALQIPELEAILEKKEIEAKLIPALAAYGDGSAGRACQLQQGSILELQQEAMSFVEKLQQYNVQDILQLAKKMSARDKQGLQDWFCFLAMIYRDLIFLYNGSKLPLYNQGRISQLSALLTSYTAEKLFSSLQLVREYEKRNTANVNMQLSLEGFIIKLKDLLEE